MNEVKEDTNDFLPWRVVDWIFKCLQRLPGRTIGITYMMPPCLFLDIRPCDPSHQPAIAPAPSADHPGACLMPYGVNDRSQPGIDQSEGQP
jgi:hypothetical protein